VLLRPSKKHAERSLNTVSSSSSTLLNTATALTQRLSRFLFASDKAMNAQEIFDAIAEGIASDPSTALKIGGLFHFKIGNKSWTVDLKSGNGSVKQGAPASADCTVICNEADFVNLMTGKVNGQNLFMQGKLKIQGNMGLAMKLDKIPKKKPDAKSDSSQGSNSSNTTTTTTTTTAAAAAASTSFRSKAVFEDLKKRIAQNSNLVQQINGIYQFDISRDGKTESWTVDLKNGQGSVSPGQPSKADCTLVIGDDDFVGMMTGKLNSQQLFSQGKLKIRGNMGLAMKLTKLQQPKSAL